MTADWIWQLNVKRLNRKSKINSLFFLKEKKIHFNEEKRIIFYHKVLIKSIEK